MKKKAKEESILLVTDDLASLQEISRVMGTWGYDILKASAGKEALHFLGTVEPDVILLEGSLADMDSYELCRQMKANPKTEDIPVLMMMDEYDGSRLEALYAAGAVDYLIKPLIKAELRSRVKSHLALKSSNAHMERRIKEEVSRQRMQDVLVLHRSKLTALGEMLASLAHQWRQPLATINFIIENILEDMENSEPAELSIKQSLNRVENQVISLSQVIDKYINFYQSSRTTESFEITSVVLQTLLFMDPEMDRYSIKVITQFPDHPLLMKGNEFDFKQIIYNIINNAKNAIVEKREQGLMGNDEGEIKVAVSNDGIITISNNAGPIPQSIKDKIFTPHSTSREGLEGMSIGLYLVKNIIEDHMKGGIQLENKEEGPEFTLNLPLGNGTDSKLKP